MLTIERDDKDGKNSPLHRDEGEAGRRFPCSKLYYRSFPTHLRDKWRSEKTHYDYYSTLNLISDSASYIFFMTASAGWTGKEEAKQDQQQSREATKDGKDISFPRHPHRHT